MILAYRFAAVRSKSVRDTLLGILNNPFWELTRFVSVRISLAANLRFPRTSLTVEISALRHHQTVPGRLALSAKLARDFRNFALKSCQVLSPATPPSTTFPVRSAAQIARTTPAILAEKLPIDAILSHRVSDSASNMQDTSATVSRDENNHLPQNRSPNVRANQKKIFPTESKKAALHLDKQQIFADFQWKLFPPLHLVSHRF